jgi:hypothetical protein
MSKQANVTGWPAVVFLLLIFLGLADVIERLIAAVS